MEEKIYGIYPGTVTCIEEANNYNEVELFLMIEIFESHMKNCYKGLYKGAIDDEQIAEKEYGLEYLRYLTRKFGVEFPTPTLGQHVPKTESYNKWLNYYAEYVHSKPLCFVDEVFIAMSKRQDSSHLLPEKKWNEEETKKMKLTI